MSMPIYVPPEQLMKDRAEFARKGIARGRSIAAVTFAHGILLIGENPSGSLHKIGEIYDRVAFAGVGRFSEFEMLRVAGVRYADVKGYAYARADVTAKGLANAYSQTLGQIFTHEVKPYEIEVMVTEIGPDPADTQLYRVSYDGTLQDEVDFAAMGGKEEELRTGLRERYQESMDLATTVRMAAAAIEIVEGHQIAAPEWEAAVLDRTLGRRKFRRLTAAEIETARSG